MIATAPRRRRIAIRVDSSAAIGAGHLRRCLTLAEALQKSGDEVIFVTRTSGTSLDSDVEASGFMLVQLPSLGGPGPANGIQWSRELQKMDARDTITALQPVGALDILIVDHYGLGIHWERTMRPQAPRLGVIDDLADRPHDCDILVDVAPASHQRYGGLVGEDCILLIGADYAMLRPEFVRLRNQTLGRDGRLRRILVSFGATDLENRCGTAIQSIRSALGPDIEIDVMVGRAYPHRAALAHLASSDARLHLHVDTPDAAGLMASADLAIGAGGTTSWERACLGLPALVAAVADNQRASVAGLVDAGCATCLPADEAIGNAIAHSLEWFSAHPVLVRMMGEAGRKLVDGRGAARVAHAISPASLALRRATADDSRDLWTWRNDEKVRNASKNQELISWEVHQEWLERRLRDIASIILISEESSVPVGVLRFNLEGDRAVVSIYLTRRGLGRGLGTSLLRAGEEWIKDHYPDICRIDAEIMPHNAASVAAFDAADYELRLLRYERDLKP